MLATQGGMSVRLREQNANGRLKPELSRTVSFRSKSSLRRQTLAGEGLILHGFPRER